MAYIAIDVLFYINLFAFLVLMTLAGRAHGAGDNDIFGDNGRIWSQIVFSLAFGAASAHLHHGIEWAPLGVISGIAMARGVGNFMHDGVAEKDFPDEPEQLERITGLHWLLPRLGMPSRSKWYCRVMMGIRWGLIASPALQFGLPMVILGPFAYAVCFQPQKAVTRMKRSSLVAEWLVGPFAAACAVAAFMQ